MQRTQLIVFIVAWTVWYIVEGASKEGKYGYNLTDLAAPSSKGEVSPYEPSSPRESRLDDLTKKCYQSSLVPIKPSVANMQPPNVLHYTLLKSTKTEDCKNIKLLKLQAALLAGKSEFQEDRFPIGSIDYDTAGRRHIRVANDADFRTHLCGKAKPNFLLHTAPRTLQKSTFKTVKTLNSIYHWVGSTQSLDVDPEAIVVFDTNIGSMESDLPNQDNAYEWQAIVCFYIEYQSNDSVLDKMLNFEGQRPFLNLDMVSEMMVTIDDKPDGVWTSVSQRLLLQWIYANPHCTKVGSYNDNAGEEYNEPIPYLTNMCMCTKGKYALVSGYEPTLSKPILPIRELTDHYDKNLKNCFELKIKEFIDPDVIWVHLWIKQCENYFVQNFELRPVLGHCGSIIALDSIGLPFGQWTNDLHPICSSGPNKCTDENDAQVIYSTTRGAEICPKPPAYDKQDPEKRIRSADHSLWSLEFVDSPCVTNDGKPCKGYSWIHQFRPNYLESEFVKKFQFIAELEIVRVTDKHPSNPPDMKPLAWVNPEVVVVRSPVYELNIDNNFNIIGSPIPKPSEKNIRIHNMYSKHNGDRCRQNSPNPADFHLCRQFHKKIGGDDRINKWNFYTDTYEKYKECFTLDAFPGPKANSLHVKFRQYSAGSSEFDAKKCSKLFGVEFGFQAMNELGFPTGKPSESFSIYNDVDGRLCTGEDLATPPETIDYESVNYPCYYDKTKIPKYTVDNVKDERTTPTLFLARIPADKNKGGICLIWEYPTTLQKNPPKTVQIFAEVYIPKAVSGTDDNIFLLLSQRYSFTFEASSPPPTRGCHDTTASSGFKQIPGDTDIDTVKELYEECKADKEELCPVEFYRTPRRDFYLCRYFHQEVPFYNRKLTFGPQITLPNMDQKYKDCFTLDAFPTSKPNALHVRFRQHVNSKPECKDLAAVEVAFQAVNEHGYPVGDPVESFRLFDQTQKDLDEFCDKEDLLRQPQLDVAVSRNYQCFYIPDEKKREKYTQKVDNEESTPQMFGFKVASKIAGDICLIWVYRRESTNTILPPKTVQIYAEAYIPDVQKIAVLGSQTYKYLNPNHSTPDARRDCHFDAASSFFTLENDASHSPIVVDEFIAECKKNKDSCPVALTDGGGGHLTLPPVQILTGTFPPPFVPTPKPPEPPDVDVYEGCTVSKGCISPPTTFDEPEPTHDQCYLQNNRNCEMVVTFGDNPKEGEEVALNKELILEIYNPRVEKWLAIGISNEHFTMGPAYVIECVIEEDGINIYHSFNLAHKRANSRMRGKYSHKSSIKLLHSQRKRGGLYCRFAIKRHILVKDPNVTTVNNPINYDLIKVPYYLLYAWGNTVTMDGELGNLEKHSFSHTSSKQIGLGARFSPHAEQQDLIRVHSTCMIAAVVFFLSLGMFSGRYYKETCVKIKIGIYPLWLFIHVISMTAVVVLFIGALAAEIIAHEGWTSVVQDNFHSYVGCVAYGLSILVYGMGFFIKPSQYEKTNITGLLHTLGGNLVYLMCFMLIMKADRITFSGLTCQIKWIVGMWGLIYSIFQCFFTYQYWWVDYILGLRKKRGKLFSPIPVVYAVRDSQTSLEDGFRLNLKPHKDQNPIEAPGSKVRLGAFIVIFLLSLMYSSWGIFLIVRNNKGGKGDCHTPQQILDFSKK